MVILIFDLNQPFHDPDLILFQEQIKINAMILIFDLKFSRSLALISIFMMT